LRAEKSFKNAATRRAAKNFAENVERVMESAAKTARESAARAPVKRRVAILVVSGAALRVAQCFVSLAEFLEFFLGVLVTGIFVGMKFHREFAICFFDFIRFGSAFDAENFIVIAFGHLIQ